MRHDQQLLDVFRENAMGLMDENKVLMMPPSRNRGGSTDMGDLSHILPAVHPYTAGAEGPGHSLEYLVIDYQQAVVNPAKIMAMSVIDLLSDNANRARRVVSSFRPAMTRAAYLKFQRQRAEVLEYDGANPPAPPHQVRGRL